jgi:hypothetical protein
MKPDTMDEYLSWFDSEIGTETETTNIDSDGTMSASCFELTANEYSKARYKATQMAKKEG